MWFDLCVEFGFEMICGGLSWLNFVYLVEVEVCVYR